MKDTEKADHSGSRVHQLRPHATATEAQKDAWLVDNADRVRLGTGAEPGTDHSTALSTVTGDTASHMLPTAHITQMKYQALVTRAALETLVQIMQNPKAPAGARVLAANAILDRGYGRPPQDITITVQCNSIDELSDAELMAIAAGAEDEGAPTSEVTH
jgi:hypothetical protein